jgi:hypothetical protein
MSTVAHLHENLISVQRESDNVWFHFRTYRLKDYEWGYELVRADGHPASCIGDPDFGNEWMAVEAIHRDLDKWERVPGYGWCTAGNEEKSVLGMGR